MRAKGLRLANVGSNLAIDALSLLKPLQILAFSRMGNWKEYSEDKVGEDIYPACSSSEQL